MAPQELEVENNATVLHELHPPREAEPVLSTPDWQPASQLSQMSQVPLLNTSNNTTPDSMFAMSAMDADPAESSMAGGPSMQDGGKMVLASMPSMHGAIDSEIRSIHGDVDADYDIDDDDDGSLSESLEAVPTVATQQPLAPMHAVSSMHGYSAALGGIAGGPSALAGMSLAGSSRDLKAGLSIMGGMHGGLSITGSRMGGEDSIIMPYPGRLAAMASDRKWCAPSSPHNPVLAPHCIEGLQ